MNYIFDKSIMEIIEERHSVRTYEGTSLSKEIVDKIEAYLDEINNSQGIFGGSVRIKLINSENNGEPIKLGTYGVIKGAKYYLAVVCKKGENSFEDLGYLFEKVVLFCTSLGLGTVWIGGTFNKGNFAKAMDLKEDELLPIVSPIGYESDKKSLISKVFGKNTNKRNDFGQVFFNENFNTPLLKEEAKEYGDVLEMVRMAPSALNKQPWKILKEGNDYHIYNDSVRDMNKIDIGIALCHFDLVAKEKGLNGKFKVLEGRNDSKYKYVVSWTQQ